MSGILNFVSENAVGSGLFVMATGAAAVAARKWWRDRKDSETIYNYLLNSKSTTAYTFRSTQAISSHTKISEQRAADLCSKHPKIMRNTKEKQSWKLVE